ncbi:MAG: STAS domain-containing protein [Myxococcota bacterium]
MQTEVEPISHLRIELDGDFWGETALTLAEQLPAADLIDVTTVSLSLRSVNHIDQAGLAMLVRLYSHLRIRGTQLQLVDVPNNVREILERVGLSRLVTLGRAPQRDVVHHTIVLAARVET